MAYVVKGKAQSWEIRESVSTDKGPRSRTLATFSELDDRTIERAQARAEAPFSDDGLRRAALRKGAPVPESRAIQAARTLLAEIARGERLPPGLADLLADRLGERPGRPLEAARAASEWLDAGDRRRAEALEDLLLLTDSLPATRRSPSLEFPRINTGVSG